MLVELLIILFCMPIVLVTLGYVVGNVRAFLDRRRNDESDSS